MNGPTAGQWRAAADGLRAHAIKFDQLADDAEDDLPVELPAPIEQLVATYNAVHLLVEYPAASSDDPTNKVIRYLQSVKPS